MQNDFATSRAKVWINLLLSHLVVWMCFFCFNISPFHLRRGRIVGRQGPNIERQPITDNTHPASHQPTNPTNQWACLAQSWDWNADYWSTPGEKALALVLGASESIMIVNCGRVKHMNAVTTWIVYIFYAFQFKWQEQGQGKHRQSISAPSRDRLILRPGSRGLEFWWWGGDRLRIGVPKNVLIEQNHNQNWMLLGLIFNEDDLGRLDQAQS